MTYTLILFLYAGILAKGDSVSTATVAGFTDKAVCVSAGAEAVKALTTGTFKDGKFICVPLSGPSVTTSR